MGTTNSRKSLRDTVLCVLNGRTRTMCTKYISTCTERPYAPIIRIVQDAWPFHELYAQNAANLEYATTQQSDEDLLQEMLADRFCTYPRECTIHKSFCARSIYFYENNTNLSLCDTIHNVAAKEDQNYNHFEASFKLPNNQE